jgi:uncharacterized protein (DUF2141 family)
MKNLSSLVTLSALTVISCSQVFAAELTLEVTGIEQAKGHILVSVSNEKGNWMRKGIKAARVPAQLEKVTIKFDDLQEGEYAISVLHDANDDGKMNTNAVGMPTETYGFSNNATGNFGPATFEQAKFTLTAENKTVSIKLN